MSELIDKFKSEHLMISDCLLKAKANGINSSKGKELIFSAKKVLLEHLAREDEHLYPVLHKFAETPAEEKLNKLLQEYALEMKDVSSKVLDFFKLYESEISNEETFQKDCDEIIKELSKRIVKEEAFLYKEYERLASKQ